MLLGCWAIVAVATLINPYGTDLIPRTLDQSTNPIWRQTISEWLPLYSRSRIPSEFIVGAVGLGAAIVVGWRRISPAAWILTLAVTGLALSSSRHLAVFGIGIGFAIAQATSGLALRRSWQSSALAALLEPLRLRHRYPQSAGQALGRDLGDGNAAVPVELAEGGVDR